MNNEKIKEIMKISMNLPEKIQSALLSFIEEYPHQIYEIHLRKNGCQNLLTSGGIFVASSSKRFEKSPINPLFLSENELEQTILNFCDGSLYSHSEELKKGFISSRGVRIGVCGNGIFENGNMLGFSSYTSLNIRFLHHEKSAANAILNHIDKVGSETLGGILIVSPPCVGKTTFLRALASAFSSGYYDNGIFSVKNCCVIDERGEIFIKSAFTNSFCDFISFLPKPYCIELCTRLMSPQYIFCDEIGSIIEADAMNDATSKGITFVATAHGKNIDDILRKNAFLRLFENKVFETVCELSINGGKRTCNIKKITF